MLLNRKLIIAVIALGLLLSFSSVAISADSNGRGKLRPIEPSLNAPFYNSVDFEARTFSPTKPFSPKPVSLQFIEDDAVRACHQVDYMQSLSYEWDLPDPYIDDIFAMRFTPEYAGTLTTIRVAAAIAAGTPSMRIFLWADDGTGLPGTEIAHWDVDYADLNPYILGGSISWQTIEPAVDGGGGAVYPDDFVFDQGEEYHIGFMTIDGVYGVTEFYAYTDAGEAAGEYRGTERYNSVWEFFADGWGADLNFYMRTHMCYVAQQFENCYFNYNSCPDPGGNYTWRMPGRYGEEYVNQRFDVTYPETLHSVSVKLWKSAISGSGTTGTPDMQVWIYPSVGGFPDIANPYTGGPVATVPFGDLVLASGTYSPPLPPVPSSWNTVNIEGVDGGNNLVMTGAYHVAIMPDPATWVDGDTLCIPSDIGACAANRTSLYDPNYGCGWVTFADPCFYELDIDLQIAVNACQDVYSDCHWEVNYGPTILGGTDFPTFGDGTNAWATSIMPTGRGCEVGNVSIYLSNWATDPVPYTYGGELAIYSSNGAGLPGTKLAWYPIPPGTNGYLEYTTENVHITDKAWLVVESYEPTGTVPDMVLLWADWVGGQVADRLAGTWGFSADWGWGYAPVMDAYICCLPLQIRICAPDGDWPTMGKNFARVQSTLNEIGDIQCNLTKSWTYQNPDKVGAQFNQPIIADGKVFLYMFNSLVCLDINDGSVVWKRSIDYAEIAGSCRATPTYDYDDNAIYCGGGDGGYFTKFNASTGVTIWTKIMNSHAQYAPHVIMDVGGTKVVFVADGAGNLYGLDAATGASLYPDWNAGGQIHKGLTTDGTYLYVGCDQYNLAPNLFCIDPTGNVYTEVWNFVDDGPGWQLQNVTAGPGWSWPETSQEGIVDAILYSDEGAEGQWLYFVGRYDAQNSSPVHNGGILYAVSADGATLRWVHECNGGGASAAGGGIIDDRAQVIYGGWSYWIEGGEYYGPMAYSKATGTPVWGPRSVQPYYGIQTIPDTWGHTSQPGLLTCESLAEAGDNDWLIFGNEFGYWNFANASLGEVVWHRRNSRFVAYTCSPVLDEAGHLIMADGYDVHMLANGAPRQRLHIAEMHPELQVPFGLSSYEEIVFADILANTGCADLEIFHVALLDSDNGTFPTRVSTVNSQTAENISLLAEKETGITAKLATMTGDLNRVDKTKLATGSSAFALPAYIISLLEPADGTIIPGGGAVDIRIAIDGTKVPRGASQFYAEVDSDDPDYFLDSAYMDVPSINTAYAKPTVLLTVVGGCVYNDMTLHFGNGGANHTSLWNSTLIMVAGGGGDDGFLIDGNTSYLYGCDGLFYSIDTERVAMHAYDGGGDPTWEGILPDPLPTCDFAVANDVLLAKMSDDGSAYSNVLGTIVNYAYVDSIQNHYVLTIDTTVTPWDSTVDWDWAYQFDLGLNQTYSNALTDGWAFKALVSEYAVTDVTGPKLGFDDFWNFTIKRHAVYSRYGYAVPGLYVGMIADWDVDQYKQNTTGYSEAYSISWIYDPTSVGPTLVTGEPDFGGGLIKVPFGPNYMPMINSVDATTSWYGDEEPGFDSIYVWMSRPSTQFTNYKPFALGEDRRMWSSITRLDLPAWSYTGDENDPVPPEAFDTYGFAFFGKFTNHNAANVDNYTGMATLVNQFCGFGRGDANNDGVSNLVDIVYLNNYVNGSGNGPFPFEHLGDIDGISGVDNGDILYLINWYFSGGPGPIEDWSLPQFGF